MPLELKPSKGLKVKVTPSREAIFGEDGVQISKISLGDGKGVGVMTGMTLAGFAEIEMPALDGKRHWYPVGELVGEKGEAIVEEPIEIEVPEDDDSEAAE